MNFLDLIHLDFLDLDDYPNVQLQLGIFTFVIFTVLIYKYFKHPFKLWQRLGIHGPEPKLIFGNVHEIYSPKGARAAYSKWQSQYGRRYGIYFFRMPALVITDPEWIKHIFVKDFNNFRDRMSFDDNVLINKEVLYGLFFATGDVWKRIRGIMTPSFSVSKIKSMVAIVNRSAARLGEHVLKLAEEGTPWEAKLYCGAFALDVVTGTGFSIDVDSVKNLNEPFTRHGRSLFIYKWGVQLLAILVHSFPILMCHFYRLFGIAFFKSDDMKFFDRNIKQMIDQRKEDKEKRNDILQNLMEAESDVVLQGGSGKLTSEELVAQGIMLFIAGYETASSTLQFLLYELATHKEVMEKIIAEIDDVIGDQEPTYDLCQNLNYIEATINETLRMYPPLSVIHRECSKPTRLFDLDLPAKTAIIVPVYNLQRDPEYWKNPDEFNPDRFLAGSTSFEAYNPFTFMPFGHGPRLCIGMKLGMMKMKLAVVHIFKRIIITKATPEILHINDFSSILQPSVPITIHCAPREHQKLVK
ncbi:cytochrome P450 3A29-like isoform X2 [Biomphalaria glabrata]|nr:cytochrome P450 3A29-like isoform X2 [Biomphalaria glabrata]